MMIMLNSIPCSYVFDRGTVTIAACVYSAKLTLLCLSAHAPRVYSSQFVCQWFCQSVYAGNSQFLGGRYKLEARKYSIWAQHDNILNLIVLDFRIKIL